MDKWPAIPAPEPECWGDVPLPVECGEALVDLADVAPEIGYAAIYLREGRPGALSRCLLRRTAAERLKQAAAALPEGYSLLVYDALRPRCVQQDLYDECLVVMKGRHPAATEEELTELVDEFVAKPQFDRTCPAPHTTGGAVDLTVCKDGIPLDMGTEFDDNTERAHADWLETHDENDRARDNRRLLHAVMTGAGFVSHQCEWWHFAYGERLWAMRNGETPIYGFCSECEG